MLPKRSALVAATAAALLAALALIELGGARTAVVACAFALMIAGPIAILAWFGSLSKLEEKRSAHRRQLKSEESDALLWQRTLHDLEASPSAHLHRAPQSQPDPKSANAEAAQRAFARVADALATLAAEGRQRATSPILALCVMVVSAIGIAGCGVPPEAWAMVRPGIGTAELVALVGGPDYVRSNGTAEVWQYCRDFPGRDEGRWARYYTAVLVDRQVVQQVQPYPVMSAAGCEDYYRAEF